MSLRNLVLDFNAYFASVEQQLQPNLRGKPVAVVPVMADSTCCIAASYEAKAFGIKTGTRVSDAKKLCPGIKLIEAKHRYYIEYHHKLISAVEECLPVETVMSIDEMGCLLTGRHQKREEAIEVAKQIKKNIADKVGEYLRCSIGIAPNHYLAKTATDMKKPDGLVVIEEGDLPQCLYVMKLNGLCGIGRGMEPRLRKLGIDTVEKLCKAPKEILRKAWGGIEGERMYSLLRGEVVKRPLTQRQTVGHSHVLPPEERTKERAYAVLSRLLQKAAMRMRNIGYATGSMGIRVGFLDGQKFKRGVSFSYSQNTIELLKILDQLWENYPAGNYKPISVAVAFFNLIREDLITLPLFGDFQKTSSLNKAVDKLNKRYGFQSAYYASSHQAIKSAPMRIAFSQIPDLDLEEDEKQF